MQPGQKVTDDWLRRVKDMFECYDCRMVYRYEHYCIARRRSFVQHLKCECHGCTTQEWRHFRPVPVVEGTQQPPHTVLYIKRSSSAPHKVIQKLWVCDSCLTLSGRASDCARVYEFPCSTRTNSNSRRRYLRSNDGRANNEYYITRWRAEAGYDIAVNTFLLQQAASVDLTRMAQTLADNDTRIVSGNSNVLDSWDDDYDDDDDDWDDEDDDEEREF